MATSKLKKSVKSITKRSLTSRSSANNSGVTKTAVASKAAMSKQPADKSRPPLTSIVQIAVWRFIRPVLS